jgi:hypothetical protein
MSFRSTGKNPGTYGQGCEANEHLSVEQVNPGYGFIPVSAKREYDEADMSADESERQLDCVQAKHNGRP